MCSFRLGVPHQLCDGARELYTLACRQAGVVRTTVVRLGVSVFLNLVRFWTACCDGGHSLRHDLSKFPCASTLWSFKTVEELLVYRVAGCALFITRLLQSGPQPGMQGGRDDGAVARGASEEDAR